MNVTDRRPKGPGYPTGTTKKNLAAGTITRVPSNQKTATWPGPNIEALRAMIAASQEKTHAALVARLGYEFPKGEEQAMVAVLQIAKSANIGREKV